jgi:adenylate cyclase
VLNSNLAEAWHCGGWVKIWLGEPEAAIERFARAMRLSPLDLWVIGMRTGTAHAHFFLGRVDEAASWAAMALQDNPRLSSWTTYRRRKQCNDRTAGARTEGNNSA